MNPACVYKKYRLDVVWKRWKLLEKRVKHFTRVSRLYRELRGLVELRNERIEFGAGLGVAAVVVLVEDLDLLERKMKMSGERVLFGFLG